MVNERGEPVLVIGVEGGGAAVYRVRDRDGAWRYFHNGSSIGLDENDEEEWRSWTSEQSTSYAESVDAIIDRSTWVLFSVMYVHRDYRDETLAMVEAAAPALAVENADRIGYILHSWREMCSLTNPIADDWLERRRERR